VGQGGPVLQQQLNGDKAAQKKETAEEVEKERLKELNRNLLAINRFMCSAFVFLMFLMNLVLWTFLGN
jgi:hypothetical protein